MKVKISAEESKNYTPDMLRLTMNISVSGETKQVCKEKSDNYMKLIHDVLGDDVQLRGECWNISASSDFSCVQAEKRYINAVTAMKELGRKSVVFYESPNGVETGGASHLFERYGDIASASELTDYRYYMYVDSISSENRGYNLYNSVSCEVPYEKELLSKVSLELNKGNELTCQWSAEVSNIDEKRNEVMLDALKRAENRAKVIRDTTGLQYCVLVKMESDICGCNFGNPVGGGIPNRAMLCSSSSLSDFDFEDGLFGENVEPSDICIHERVETTWELF